MPSSLANTLTVPNGMTPRQARLKPSGWAGAYACWGLENRETALRLEAVEGPSAASSANVEWKSVDMAANPYLVQGAILAAGLDGGVVDLHVCHPQTEVLRVAHLGQQVGGAQHRLGGNAGVVEAASPHLVALDHSRLQPELRGPDRSDVSTRP